MKHKITWRMIRTDFKKMYPDLSKNSIYWCPCDYLTIMIYLKDGKKITYNYETHDITILSDSWMHDK